MSRASEHDCTEVYKCRSGCSHGPADRLLPNVNSSSTGHRPVATTTYVLLFIVNGDVLE
jgi:hypothetical protein